jgi:hypothetical protein
MLEWTECRVSGQWKAEGVKGQYWIDDCSWSYLEIVTVDAAGPRIERIDCYVDLEEAKKGAELHDKTEVEDA